MARGGSLLLAAKDHVAHVLSCPGSFHLLCKVCGGGDPAHFMHVMFEFIL